MARWHTSPSFFVCSERITEDLELSGRHDFRSASVDLSALLKGSTPYSNLARKEHWTGARPLCSWKKTSNGGLKRSWVLGI